MGDTWTVKRILDWTVGFFETGSVPEPRLSAELLLAHALSCRRIDLYVQFERILSMAEREACRELVRRRAAHEPVQYIIGETEFMGLPFAVNPAVLIPRPDTETLVDAVLEHARTLPVPPRILDIGTGSGCIAVSLAHHLPGAAVTAIDISEAALAVAEGNAARNGVTVAFRHLDMRDLAALAQPFDIVVSNPPYIGEGEWAGLERQVRDYEPREALLAPDEGMAGYALLAEAAPALTGEAGRIYLECGYRQARSVAGLLAAQGLQTGIRRDFTHIERVVYAARQLPEAGDDPHQERITQ